MAYRNWRVGVLAIVTGLALAGCLPEISQPTTQAPAEEPPNAAPTISGTPGTAATAGIAWQFQPSAGDADGDPLTFSATGLPGWANLNTQTGRVSGMPTENDVGVSAAIVISVSDGEASASLPSFSITVATGAPPPPPPPPPPVNTRPSISGAPGTTVQATAAYSFTPAATDAETPQTLTFAILNRPGWASFSTTTGRLSGTPAANQTGTYANIVISVSDGALTAALPAFTITVTAAPNRPPVISGTPSTSVTVGSAYSFRPTASDPDGQTLSYSIANKPAWAAFSSTTGRLSGTPAEGDVGTTSNIVITVTDTQGAAASLAAFSLTVNARPNRAPSVSGTPATSVAVGGNYSFTPSASDPDGDTLTWSISGKPATATFNTSTGRLTWTPAEPGTNPNIVITVTDEAGASASLPAFTITVTPPVTTGSAALSWTAPTHYTDGTTLPGAGLAAYRIYYGTSASSLGVLAEVDGDATSFTAQDLAPGTHYFAVTAISMLDVESDLSPVRSKTVP